MRGLRSILDRHEWEAVEKDTLAPWAVKSCETAGRCYPEPEDDLRSVFQRDRDRIIHCMAFRRLEYKTQVFVNHEGDYYRTRLTHTLEVAQIARSIARVLRLNVDLTEAIALAHDIGHTPFGHAGEAELRDLMKGHGGFEHNEHGLRVVDLLEQRHDGHPGLNLSYEVREGIIKHTTPHDAPRWTGFEGSGGAPLEAQVVDSADEIAYNNHDLDDGLTAGLLAWEQLEEVALWARWRRELRERYPKISERVLKARIISALINEQVRDLVATSHRNLTASAPSSAPEVRAYGNRMIHFSPEMAAQNLELKDFLMKNMYRHYRVVRMTTKARRFLRDLFTAYVSHPEQMPVSYQQRMDLEGTERVVCDYVAGMTDRYALDEYRKLFIPWERV